MARYRITGPDGRVYTISGPDDATDDELISVIKNQAAPEPQGAGLLEKAAAEVARRVQGAGGLEEAAQANVRRAQGTVTPFGTIPAAPADLIRGINQGASLGFSDEIVGGATSALTGKPFAEAVQAERAPLQRFQRDQPITSMASEVVGSAPLMALAPGMAPPGGSAVGNIARGATGAGAFGYGYGFGTGEGDIGERTRNAERTALISALMGGGFTAGAELAPRALGAMGRAVQARAGQGNKRSFALRKAAQVIMEDSPDMTPDVAFIRAQNELDALGPQAVVGDTGENARAMTGAVYRMGGRPKALIGRAVTERQKGIRDPETQIVSGGQYGRITEALEGAAERPSGLAAQRSLKAQQGRASTPLYERTANDPANLVESPLPMDEASRLARARAQGFDVERPIYHGTAAKFDRLKPSEISSSTHTPHETPAIFATKDPALASQYAESAGIGRRQKQADIFARHRREMDVPAETFDNRLHVKTQKRLRALAHEAMPEGHVLRSRGITDNLSDPNARINWDNLLKEFPEAKEGLRLYRLAKEYEHGWPTGANVRPVFGPTQDQMLVVDAKSFGGNFNETIYDNLLKRAKAQGYKGLRVKNVVDSPTGTGPASDVVAVFDPKNIRSRFDVFEPETGRVPQVLSDPYVADQIAKVKGSKLHGLKDMPDNAMPVIDAAQKRMSDQASKAYRAGKTYEGNLISEKRRELVAAADEAFPEYAQAREVWRDFKGVMDADDLGRKFMSGDVDVLEDAVSRMKPEELKQFRAGAVRALKDVAGKTKAGGDITGKLVEIPLVEQKLRVAFGEDFPGIMRKLTGEKGMHELYREVTGGSPTQPRQMAQKALEHDPGAGVGAVLEIAKRPTSIGTWLGAGARAVGNVAKRAAIPEGARMELAKALMSGDLAPLMQQAQAVQGSAAARRRLAQALMAGTLAGTPSRARPREMIPPY